MDLKKWTPWRAVRRTAALGIGAAVLAAGFAVPQTASAAIPTAPNGAPQTIPALQNWQSLDGEASFGANSRIVTDAESRETAELLADELREVFDRDIAVVTEGPQSGDVVLDQVSPEILEPFGLDAEGYYLSTVGAFGVTGSTEEGVFYGTRSLLQMLAQSTTVQGGYTLDQPQFEERGAGICACQIQVSPEFFERLMKDMAFNKLNQLWIETKIESEAYPEANFWAYYTSEQGEELQAIADRYHIELIPEVNSPGHMRPWIENYPEYQLVDSAGQRQPTRLDITKPEALAFVTTIIDEYFETFDGPYWHMGADEYMLGSDYSRYPQIEAYMDARPNEYGPDAVPEDVYIDFINKVNDHVRSKGKTLRVWNDGIPKVATHEVDKNVVIEFWDGRENLVQAKEILARGYDIQNASYSLYLIRNGGANPLNERQLWESGWTPRVFDATPGDPTPLQDTAEAKVRGAKITAWPDFSTTETEQQVEAQLFGAIRFIAQSTWGTARPAATYDAFVALSNSIGRAPGYENIDRDPLASGKQRLFTADGRGLAVKGGALTAVTADAGEELVLTTTDDGYYRIATTGGSCLAMQGGKLWLGAPVEAGLPVAVRTQCANDNQEKWQLKAVEGGVQLLNATTLMPVTVEDRAGTATLVQRPADIAAPVVLTLVGPEPEGPKPNPNPGEGPNPGPNPDAGNNPGAGGGAGGTTTAGEGATTRSLADERLASTGTEIAVAAGIGLVLLLLGAGLIVRHRRLG